MTVDWGQAACRHPDTNPDDWHPTVGAGAGVAATARARRTCTTCPLQTPCLTHALTIEAGMSRDHRHGVWGGLTPDQRYELDQGAARLRGPRP